MKVKLGVSACLLGSRVRYDGGGKYDPLLCQTWGDAVQFIPICPETEAGLGVPREPVELRALPDGGVRVVGRESARDITPILEDFCADKAKELESLGLWGFVLKARSPSCGLKVTIHGGDGAGALGSGLFARTMRDKFPHLPLIDEESLKHPPDRERFVAKLFVLHSWRNALAAKPSRQALAEFHCANSFLLLAFDPGCYGRMGRLLVWAKEADIAQTCASYLAELEKALSGPPSSFTGMLTRLAAHLGPAGGGPAPLDKAIALYGAGKTPLGVPLGLISKLAGRGQKSPLGLQTCLDPAFIQMLSE